jgi:tRNA 2-thiocytidine biosynthesis protein TtcA
VAGPRERLENDLLRQVGKAIDDWKLIEAGDRILVAVSGGKDSWALLHLLRALRRRSPVHFDLLAVNVDQGHPGFPQHVLADHLKAEGFEHKLLHQNTYDIVKERVPEGKTWCSFCSRLRRGILYNAAVELGCSKIALGHHREDLVETLLLNLFYTGQLKAMPARLRSDDGRNTVIRPLAYCAESDLAEYARLGGFPIVPCNVCGAQEDHQRKAMKELVTTLEGRVGARIRPNLLAALRNVRASHLLDPSLPGAGGGLESEREADAPPALPDGDGARAPGGLALPVVTE